ncbi:hypothetical protein J2S20_000361 [Moryella indoligenes]|uniref:Uncharacterized protein n=1 Tax=Moryella indoligenes TaxID=371674 RepID=A0AAE3V8E8_9FIRM|nr:hypothetical protein [Moryella indoligenes]MDQ0151681.1 hypothetical protein [Moryella indoligenes]
MNKTPIKDEKTRAVSVKNTGNMTGKIDNKAKTTKQNERKIKNSRH